MKSYKGKNFIEYLGILKSINLTVFLAEMNCLKACEVLFKKEL